MEVGFWIKKMSKNILKQILTQEHDVSASSSRHYQKQIIKVLR